MTISSDNFRIGACKVIFNSIDLGALHGTAEISVEGSFTDEKSDQWGDVLMNKIIKGKNAKAKVPLTEAQIDQLKNVFGDWTVAGTTNKKVSFATNVGTDLRSLAKELKFERLKDPNTVLGTHDSWTFPLAVPVGPYNEKFTWDGQQVYEVEFIVFANLTDGTLGYRGYPTAS